jgi:hypothetical protein
MVILAWANSSKGEVTMPNLVFSSEKAGCGATIELDNGETCLISVAQTGVLVRSYKKGFLSGIVGSFLGPVLYNEKKVYLVAETAASLSSMRSHFPIWTPIATHRPEDVYLGLF